MGVDQSLLAYLPLIPFPVLICTKMPVAVEQDRAVFTYIHPGMGTRTDLDSWGAAHRRLWDKLRQSGCRAEVVAVAWEQKLLDGASRVLRFWHGRGITEADWDTVERHVGFNAVVEKIVQWEQENPVTKGRRSIDDFRLWGSRQCRRMGEYSTETRLFTGMAHTLDNHNDSFSEGGALAAVVSVLPGKPYWKRVGTDSPGLMRPSEASLRLARPPSPGAAARRARGVLVVGATPVFAPRGAARTGDDICAPICALFIPSFGGVAPSTEIPGGKAIQRYSMAAHMQETLKPAFPIASLAPDSWRQSGPARHCGSTQPVRAPMLPVRTCVVLPLPMLAAS